MAESRKPQDFVQMRSRAGVRASFRALVSGYLVYLGWQTAKGASSGESTSVQPWMGWTVFGVFTAVAVVFALYAWKQYKADLKAAEPSAEEKAAMDAAAEEDMDPDGDDAADI